MSNPLLFVSLQDAEAASVFKDGIYPDLHSSNTSMVVMCQLSINEYIFLSVALMLNSISITI